MIIKGQSTIGKEVKGNNSIWVDTRPFGGEGHGILQWVDFYGYRINDIWVTGVENNKVNYHISISEKGQA